jgi:hypothetical protein
MEKLSPTWYPAPSHWTNLQKRKKTSLRHRIEVWVLPRLRFPVHDDVRSKLQDLCDLLEPLETAKVGLVLQEHINAAVRKCAIVSVHRDLGSLELQLKDLLVV